MPPDQTSSTWSALLDIAARERPYTHESWQTHRALFQEWLQCPLREQAVQIREFLGGATPGDFPMGLFEDLIPWGEPEMCRELFVSDLENLFCVLAAPPRQRKTFVADSGRIPTGLLWKFGLSFLRFF